MVASILCVCGALLLASPLAAVAATARGAGTQQPPAEHGAARPGQVQRSEVAYDIPAVTLLRQDHVEVNFPAALDDGRPVILTFIFTTCTTICPMLTHVFQRVQQELGEQRSRVHLVSISIDPEYDTVARLEKYSKQVGAGPQWNFYTGSADAISTIQKAFDSYPSYDKMDHLPLIFLRAGPGKRWIRLEGLVSPAEVIREYRGLVRDE